MPSSRISKKVQSKVSDFFHVVKSGYVEKPKNPTKAEIKAKKDQWQGLGISAEAGEIRLKKREVTAAQNLIDGGVESVGVGIYQTAFEVKILQKPSSAFFEGPIPTIDKSAESVAKYRRDAMSYPAVDSSTVVRCTDGTPLLYFIKGGMLAGLSSEEQAQLPDQSLSAIRQLLRDYPPPPPKKENSRISQLQEEEKEKMKAKWHARGQYDLMYHYARGRPDRGPLLAAHCTPTAKGRKEALAEYMRATSWEHTQLARWISALDPKKYQELHACYQDLGPEELEHMYQGPEACHSGLVILVNLAVHPHKDRNDARDNWTSTNTHGSYRGGNIVMPELGIKFNQAPNDIVLTHAAVLTHFLEDIEDGDRFCDVRFTKKDILEPVEYHPLNIPCPMEGCSRILPSEHQLKTHLGGPTGKRRLTAKVECFHWVEKGEMKAMVERAMGDVLKRNTDKAALLEGASTGDAV